MNSKVIDILKKRDLVVPSFLITNYKTLGLKSNNVIMLIYLLNQKEPIICNYELFANELNMNIKEVMNEINDLVELKLIEINIKKNKDSKLEEYINMDLFYNKEFLQVIDVKEDKESSSIYSTFEKELGRTLSPIEYELINGWLECNYKEEVILEALKEAVFNGVNNFRYIDKILFEWNKKGIDSIEKIEKNRSNHKKNKVEVVDYDWLNSDE